MCGIAGHLQDQKGLVDYHFIENAKSTLAPRGPDSEGVHHLPGCTLVHTRLSIQDLSMRGHQPMRLPEVGLSIVYNGEVYNFYELKDELEEIGHTFFSHSDTEVLLRGYLQWGDELLSKLNGMFAFAIYDETKEELFLARDRLGIKPLYYRSTEKGLYFSSDLRPLIHVNKSSAYLDPEALNYYMSFHSVVPAPKTLVKDVYKLEPGHCLKIGKDKKLQKRQYWRLKHQNLPEQSAFSSQDWKEAIFEELKKAVKRRLVADVPVGIFLSGGLDSSLITALMADMNTTRVSTFSVGFSQANEELGDEFKYSRAVAQRFDTDHHEIRVSSSELLEFLPEALEAHSEPMVSHDNVGFYLLSRFASKHIKVVQSGQGADEVFAGYHWYPKLTQSKHLAEDYQREFFDYSLPELNNIFQRPFQKDFALNYVSEHFAQVSARESLDRVLNIDTTVMLVEDPVKRVDNNTMRWGLEARVPFLDHKLVELAAQLPNEFKLSRGGKGVLKEIGYDILPHEVIDRPKGYFPVPELKYIQGPFLKFVQEILAQPGVKQRSLFKEDYIQTLLKDPKSHITPLRGSKLWQIAVLENWLQTNRVEVER